MRRRLLIGLVAVQMALVAACTNGADVADYYRQQSASSSINTDVLKRYTGTSRDIRSYLSGTTARSFGPGHGTQIEYTAPSGATYLWYPGNIGIVTGFWQVRDGRTGPLVCFLYPTTSSNPVTGQRGGDWECQSAVAAILFDTERVQGNPFGLTAGPVPSVLPRGANVTFATLAGQLGIPAGNLTRLETPR